ncbi:hypothetical protein [Marinifilum fragile]|uniref:hypothetical protein n=1 Tax=Marinifilum fragile TaxID=570161 RepID=UPI002AA9124B|nr:hypothetical protein [Marinifilum fragile]
MIISKIKTERYIYFNMHAEEVVTSNFIKDDNAGIYCDRLQIETVQRIIDSLEGESNKTVVFDFSDIVDCQANLQKRLISLKNDEYKILLLNLNKNLCSELSLDSIKNLKNSEDEDCYLKFFMFEDDGDVTTELEINTPKLFENEFKNRIKNYIVKEHNEPHTSSFVYLIGFVDMKRFISYEKAFMMYSLYKLALKIKKELKDQLNEKPILVCQSLNSAYLVSILSTLLGLDIIIFDKIGPVNKLYNRLDSRILDKRKYIVVSDLVCLGTEVKIVKNLIHFIGGKCLGNISLIKTETLSKAHIKKVNATIAIFSIKKENNKELGYTITTDLEPVS